MNEPIKAGDLVVVVEPRVCGCQGKISFITTVTRIWVAQTGTRCDDCGHETFDPVLYADDANGWIATVRRLKRIPPLSELEGEKRREEISA